MFAGPNGSGKSTIKRAIPNELLGIYINPDELEAELRLSRGIALATRKISIDIEFVRSFLSDSALMAKEYSPNDIAKIRLVDGFLDYSQIRHSSYLSSATSDLLRHALLRAGVSFSFETVMSHRDKVEFLCTAYASGYRTYLYYVATDDPEINVSRVQNRVRQGGHDVPEEKIRTRYVRSLDLLLDAIKCTSRAYIFDNSSGPGDHFLIAEITDGTDLEIQRDDVPDWFDRAVLRKIAEQ
ncbi:MAG: zeta toxin family protein [Armatimonadetes bacterium]|nr:zeta toxin family protein [Armatimonadota bacterium]